MAQPKPKVRLDQRVLRLPAVLEFTGMSESQIMDNVARGDFPKPIKLSERAKGWLESELLDWLEERIAARDAA